MDKSRNSHSLLDDDSIEAWIRDNDPGGLAKLRTALNMERLRGPRALAVIDYLKRHDALSEAHEKAVKDALYLREVVAAERSARVAWWALLVSVISLAVSLKEYWPKVG